MRFLRLTQLGNGEALLLNTRYVRAVSVGRDSETLVHVASYIKQDDSIFVVVEPVDEVEAMLLGARAEAER